MGVMTLGNFRSEVRYRLGNRNDISNSRIDQWVNWAYFHLAQPSIHEHRSLQITGTPISLVQGTNEYDVLPATIAFITSVSYPTRRTLLDHVSINWMDRRDLTTQAQPSHYALFGESSAGASRIIIYPTPSSTEAATTLTVRGVREPSVLTGVSGSNISEYRYVWDEAIVLGAVWRGWRDLSLPQAADAREEFSAIVNDITNQLRFEGKQDPPKFSLDLVRYQQ